MSTALATTHGARIGRTYPVANLREVVASPAPYYDRDPAMLGNQLTPARLTRLLVERNYGYLQGWVDLADEMRRNVPHLHAQLALREQSAVETEFVVQPGLGSNQKAARRAATACEGLLAAWRGREENGWEEWVAEWVCSKYYMHAAHEVLWERDGRELVPAGLALVGERRLSYACGADDPDPWALRLWDAADPRSRFGGLYGVKLSDFHPDKFLVSQPRVVGGPRTTEGMFSVLVWLCLFSTWTWRDLMALNEMLGRPPVVAYYAAGGAKADGALAKLNGERSATPQEVASAKRVVNGLSGALRAVLPDTIRIDPLKFQLPTAEPVQILTHREAAALISKVINAVDSVSDLKAGARAAVEVQERTSATPWRADCRMVERRGGTLFGRYVRANPDVFGVDCPVPVVRARTDSPPDRKAVLEAIGLAQDRGMEVPAAWAYREAGFPQPAAVRGVREAVLKPLPKAPPPPPPGAPREGPPQHPPAAPGPAQE